MDEQGEKQGPQQHEGPGSGEKRHAPRIKREILVQYRIKVEHYSTVDMSATRNISETGVAFTAARAFSPGTIMMLGLRLPTQADFLELEGRVVSCESKAQIIYMLRVEFVNMSQQQQKALKEFIQFFVRG